MDWKILVKRVEGILESLRSNPELYDWKKLDRIINKFENDVKKTIKFPEDVNKFLDKVNKLNLKTIRSRIKKLGLNIVGKRKRDVIYNIGLYLLKNRDKINEFEKIFFKPKATEKVEISETWKDWLSMPPEKLRSHLQSLTLKQIKSVAKSILSSKEMKKRKSELIETIIFKLKEFKAHMRIGPP